jgi:hypothetical protein
MDDDEDAESEALDVRCLDRNRLPTDDAGATEPEELALLDWLCPGVVDEEVVLPMSSEEMESLGVGIFAGRWCWLMGIGF